MTSIVRALVLLLTLPALAAAQDSLKGTWTGQIDTADATLPITMVLSVDDIQVTGSILLPGGLELSAQDGLVTGTLVQFTTTQQGETPVVMKWAGTRSGDEIAFSVAAEDGQSAPLEFTVTRQATPLQAQN